MKADKLQVGDWVYSLSAQKFVRVQTLGLGAEYPDYNPVPITVRKLTENGFKKAVKIGFFKGKPEKGEEIKHILTLPLSEDEYRDNVTYFIPNPHKPKIRNLAVRINDKVILECKVDYIHELQQILRFCGLSGIADNININRRNDTDSD